MLHFVFAALLFVVAEATCPAAFPQCYHSLNGAVSTGVTFQHRKNNLEQFWSKDGVGEVSTSGGSLAFNGGAYCVHPNKKIQGTALAPTSQKPTDVSCRSHCVGLNAASASWINSDCLCFDSTGLMAEATELNSFAILISSCVKEHDELLIDSSCIPMGSRTATKFSLSFWFKTSVSPDSSALFGSPLFAAGSRITGNAYQFVIFLKGYSAYLSLGFENSPIITDKFDFASSPTNNQWHMVAATFENNAYVVYLDGVAVSGERIAGSGSAGQHSVGLFIKGSAGTDASIVTAAVGFADKPLMNGVTSSNYGHFDGNVDEIKVYTSSVSSAEVLASFQSSSITAASPLMLTCNPPQPAGGSSNPALCGDARLGLCRRQQGWSPIGSGTTPATSGTVTIDLGKIMYITKVWTQGNLLGATSTFQVHRSYFGPAGGIYTYWPASGDLAGSSNADLVVANDLNFDARFVRLAVDQSTPVGLRFELEACDPSQTPPPEYPRLKWDDSTPVDYVNWVSGQPDGGDAELCNYAKFTGIASVQWLDERCDAKLYSASCQKAGSCSSTSAWDETSPFTFKAFGWKGYGSFCAVAVSSCDLDTTSNQCSPTAKTHSRSEWASVCSSLGATLASVHSSGHESFLRQLHEVPHQNYWLGMTVPDLMRTSSVHCVDATPSSPVSVACPGDHVITDVSFSVAGVPDGTCNVNPFTGSVAETFSSSNAGSTCYFDQRHQDRTRCVGQRSCTFDPSAVSDLQSSECSGKDIHFKAIVICAPPLQPISQKSCSRVQVGIGGKVTVTATASLRLLDQTVTSNVATALRPISIVAVSGNTISVTLTLSTGSLSAVSPPSGITVTTTSSSEIVIGGSQSALNDALGMSNFVKVTTNQKATITGVINDGSLTGTHSATIYATAAENKGPTIAADPTRYVMNEDASAQVIGVVVADPDSTSLTLTVSLSGGGSFVLPGTSNGELAGKTIEELNTALEGLKYTPTVTASNPARTTTTSKLTVTISDGVLSASTEVTLDVKAKNDGPTIVADPTRYVMNEDASAQVIGVVVADPDSTSLTLTVSLSGGGSFVLPGTSNGELAGKTIEELNTALEGLKYTPGASSSRSVVDLGSASSFGVIAYSTITNSGPTTISGDLALHPGTSVTGSPTVTGKSHIADATALQAKKDLAAAYTAAQNMPSDKVVGTADLGGQTLLPGVYSSGSSMGITNTLYLDAQNDPDAFWVFQMGSTLTVAVGAKVVILNPAGNVARNVFWACGSSATILAGANLVGTVMAVASISVGTGAVTGPLLASNGAVTLLSNGVSSRTANMLRVSISDGALSASTEVTLDVKSKPVAHATASTASVDEKSTVGVSIGLFSISDNDDITSVATIFAADLKGTLYLVEPTVSDGCSVQEIFFPSGYVLSGPITGINSRLQSLRFVPSSFYKGGGFDISLSTVDNTGAQSNTVSVHVCITPVQNGPQLFVPGPHFTEKNTAVLISPGISLTEIDEPQSDSRCPNGYSPPSTYQVVMSVSHGTLKTDGGNGLSTLTVGGSISELKSLLKTLLYTPEAGFSETESISVVVSATSVKAFVSVSVGKIVCTSVPGPSQKLPAPTGEISFDGAPFALNYQGRIYNSEKDTTSFMYSVHADSPLSFVLGVYSGTVAKTSPTTSFTVALSDTTGLSGLIWSQVSGLVVAEMAGNVPEGTLYYSIARSGKYVLGSTFGPVTQICKPGKDEEPQPERISVEWGVCKDVEDPEHPCDEQDEFGCRTAWGGGLCHTGGCDCSSKNSCGASSNSCTWKEDASLINGGICWQSIDCTPSSLNVCEETGTTRQKTSKCQLSDVEDKLSNGATLGECSKPCKGAQGKCNFGGCDVVLVLDSGRTVADQDYDHQLKFANTVLGMIAPFVSGGARVGTVTSSSAGAVVLSPLGDVASARSAIENARTVSGSNSAARLAQAGTLLLDGASTAAGACQQIFFISFENADAETKAEATTLKEKGIKIVAFGIAASLDDIATGKLHEAMLKNGNDLEKYGRFISKSCDNRDGENIINGGSEESSGSQDGTVNEKLQTQDAKDSNSNEKVYICHKPGTPAENTLHVSVNAVSAHLDHGDSQGPCKKASEAESSDASGDSVDGGADDKHLIAICHKPKSIQRKTVSVEWKYIPSHLSHGDAIGKCGGEYTGECAVESCAPQTKRTCTTVPISVVAKGTAKSFNEEAFKKGLGESQGISPNTIVIVSVTDVQSTTERKFRTTGESSGVVVVFVQTEVPYSQLKSRVALIIITIDGDAQFRSQQGIVGKAGLIANPSEDNDDVQIHGADTREAAASSESSRIPIEAVVVLCICACLVAVAAGFGILMCYRRTIFTESKVVMVAQRDVEGGQMGWVPNAKEETDFLGRLTNVFGPGRQDIDTDKRVVVELGMDPQELHDENENAPLNGAPARKASKQFVSIPQVGNPLAH